MSEFDILRRRWSKKWRTTSVSRDQRLESAGHWSVGTGAPSALQQELCKIPTLFISVRTANSSFCMETKSEITYSPTIRTTPEWPSQPRSTSFPNPE